MKKVILVLSVAVLVALPLVFGTSFVVAEEKKGVIKVDQPAEFFKGGKKTKTPVEFNHENHGKTIACLECHHKSDEAKLKSGAEKPKACASAECHGQAAKEKMVTAEKAYHDNCKNCHKKEKKGPTKCKECHPGAGEE